MRRIAVLVSLCFGISSFAVLAQENIQPAFEECTTGVASGKATADGRPLLWKNRDTGNLNNEVVYFADGKYRYVAVVDAGSSRSAWMGVNEKGFCVENSVISDFPKGGSRGLGNGGFMKLALQTCATVNEFEALLRQTNVTGRSTGANFGVIDAQGGAAIFETGHQIYVKYDANDPQTAPDGFIVRSNFTMTGSGNRVLAESSDLTRISSGVRYLRGHELWQEAVDRNELDHQTILRTISRDLADGDGNPYAIPSGQRRTEITISRRSTASVGVFHGVKDNEDPLLTTMWVILGEPIFSIATPCWAGAESVSLELDGEQLSPLCSLALDLKKLNYGGSRLLNTAGLRQLWAVTYPVEDRIFTQTERMLAQWRRDRPNAQAMYDFHRKMTNEAMNGILRAKAVIESSEKLKAPQVFAPAYFN